MDELTVLLAVVLRWCNRCGLDDFQTATAQSLAWYWSSRSAVSYPPSHWARIAVRMVRNGRDLAGCGTGQADALSHSLQGCGMGEVLDKEPSPAVLVEHKELLDKILAEVTEIKRQVVELRLQGLSNIEVAERLGVSPGRTSQIAREIAERFRQ